MPSIRAEGRLFKLWVSQLVYISNPPISSPAALVRLSQKLRGQDMTIYTEARMCRIRNIWMKEQMATPDEKGGLTCSICGRKGLKPTHKDRNRVATLDHITDLRHGGAWRDPANFQVACYRCNCKKSA